MLPALVLSAGLGTRLDPLTRLIAKPAVPIGGRPLLLHVLDWLHREGVRDVVLNLHHRPETIAAIAGDGTHLGLRIRYSWERELLGSAGGPRHALPILTSWRQSLGDGGAAENRRRASVSVPEDAILIVNGDTLCDFPLAPMLDAHVSRGADVTMAMIPHPRPDAYNGVALGPDSRVTGFVPKGQPGGSWHFIGVQIAQAPVFADLHDNTPAETVAGIYRERLASGWRGLFGWGAQTSFVDVGTPADYLRAAIDWASTDPARLVDPSSTVDPTASVLRSVVWPGTRIGAGASLDRCVVAGGVEIPAGFAARKSVIVPASIATAADRATINGALAIYHLSW